jgi:hypothetical protein
MVDRPAMEDEGEIEDDDDEFEIVDDLKKFDDVGDVELEPMRDDDGDDGVEPEGENDSPATCPKVGNGIGVLITGGLRAGGGRRPGRPIERGGDRAREAGGDIGGGVVAAVAAVVCTWREGKESFSSVAGGDETERTMSTGWC